jgi:gamma-glutamyltranspeptidase/glutathione hydrolase
MTAVFTTRPELRGTFGMVASTHWLASAAGMAVLERGGNAADAAVAAGFVLQVVEPHLNGLGGEAPIIACPAGGGSPFVVCGQGPAPAAASIAAFADLGVGVIPGNGLLAACVPGAFDGWMLLLRDMGTMRLGEVLEYAIGYAEEGYPVVPGITAAITSVRALFAREWTESAHVYLAGGEPPAPGSLHRNRDLAATYRGLRDAAQAAGGDRVAQIEAARDAFYRGFVAETLDRWLRTAEVLDGTGQRHRAMLTGDDLARWRATTEPPLTLDYRGLRVCKTPAWGQGPVFLQQLALLDGFDFDATDPVGAEFIHVVVECAKLAFADREAWYGDPAFTESVVADLLEPGQVSARRRLVGERASLELRPSAPAGRWPRLPSWVGGDGLVDSASAAGLGLAGGQPSLGVAEPGDTCHVDVVDRWGAMVSATPSGGWLQSSPVVPGLGFCLGTRAQMLWLEVDLPNSLRGGKRPRTTLSPTLVLRDGAPYLALGTPGGDQQDQWSLLAFLRHVHFGMNLQEAIDAPTFHSEDMPSSFDPHRRNPGRIVAESRFPPGVVHALQARGHDVVVSGPWELGRVSAVARGDDSILRGAANPRGMQGYAVGR